MARSYLCHSVFSIVIIFSIETFGQSPVPVSGNLVRRTPVSGQATQKSNEEQIQNRKRDEAFAAQVEQQKKTQDIQNQLILNDWKARPVKAIYFADSDKLQPVKPDVEVPKPKPPVAEPAPITEKNNKSQAQIDCEADGKVWQVNDVDSGCSESVAKTNLKQTCSKENLSGCNQSQCKVMYGYADWKNNTCIALSDDWTEKSAAPEASNTTSKADCQAKLSEAIFMCNEETEAASSKCNIVKNESVQMANQFKGNMQQLLYQSQGQIESLGSMSTAMNGLSVAMSGLQGRCAMAKSSCSNACSAAQSIIEKCRSSLSGTLGGGNNNAASVEVSIASSITECEGLDEIVSDLENSIASVLASGQKMQKQACDIAANKNNPICSGLAFNPNTGIDCFSNPSHSSCLPPTSGGVGNLKVNPLSALPSSSTTSRGAGVTGGSLSGGDGGNYNGFNIGDSENSLNDKVFAAKPLKGGSGGPGGGGGGFGGGGGSPGGGGSAGGGPGAGATGGGMASDLEMGFGKLSGDDSIAARKLGMGSARSGPAPLERDRNGNIIYPSRDLKFNMNRFRPNLGGGRGVAGSLTIGPDGITGSNSDLWKKINIQYGYQQDTLD